MLLSPIQSEFLASAEWQATEALGYPVEKKEAVKPKKAKNLGDPAKRAAAEAARAAREAEKKGVSTNPDGSVGAEDKKAEEAVVLGVESVKLA
jgi:predicted TIM-barrel fold metal-dependent hydrolase